MIGSKITSAECCQGPAHDNCATRDQGVNKTSSPDITDHKSTFVVTKQTSIFSHREYRRNSAAISSWHQSYLRTGRFVNLGYCQKLMRQQMTSTYAHSGASSSHHRGGRPIISSNRRRCHGYGQVWPGSQLCHTTSSRTAPGSRG